MPNAAIRAGFNQSKHQMVSDVTADGVPVLNINGTQFGLMFKDTTARFNQLALKSRYFDIVDYARDENILERIKANEFGSIGHVMVSATRTGEVTAYVVTDYVWWAAAPADSVTIAIPIESGWVKDGSTVYLTNVAKRVFEKMRENVLVYL